MSQQVVSTVFKAKDKISGHFKRMKKGSDRFGKGAEDAFKKASKSAKKFKGVTSSILKASVIQKSFSMLSQGVRQLTTDFISFDDALFSAAAKFKDVDMTTAKGQETFRKLGEAARNTGKMTQFTASQAAQALDFLALAGFNAQQSMAALPELADLATAAGISDFARVVDIASDSLGAFGLATSDAAQLQKNLTRISDVFAKTQASTNTNVEMLFEAVNKGAAAFTGAGQSLETFNALTGVLANSGLKGAEAGTVLRNVMLRLSDPAKKAQKVLRQLNISIKDENNNFRNAIDIMADFEKGLKGMGTAQKTQALATVFGARAVTGVNILLKEGSKSLKEWEKNLINSGGTSKSVADVMRQSLGNRLKSLASAAGEAGFKILDAFKVNGVNSIDAFTEALRNVDIKPFIEGIKLVVGVFGNLLTLIKSTTIVMSPLIAAWIAYKTTLIATSAIMNVYGVFVTVLNLIRSGTVIATAAQWAWNVAMAANPIGAIVAAVTLLIAGIVLLIKKWTVVKNAIVSGAKAILGMYIKIFQIIRKVATFGFSKVASFFGGDESGSKDGKNAPGTSGSGIFAPPNTREANANAQRFEGVFKFENKPDNVSFEQKTFGAPLISTQGLGAN